VLTPPALEPPLKSKLYIPFSHWEKVQLPLPRLRAAGQPLEIRTADLRFTLQEDYNFLNQTMGLEPLAEDIARLDQRTEGWIVGFQMAVHSLKDLEAPTRFIRTFSGSHRYILDYLVKEVLNRQPALIQGFLLKTSVLTRLSGPLCDVVTGIQKRQADNTPSLQTLNF
jgi:LuxR family maltose regulon positive regulatory protein